MSSAAATVTPARDREPYAPGDAVDAHVRPGRSVVLLQTQAEAAGAQEVSRLLARGLEARGHVVHQVFLFRRTGSFDHDPNVVICAAERPRRLLGLIRLLLALYRHLRRLAPDTVICFQHYGNLVGGPVARLAGIKRVVANHNGLQAILSRTVVALDRLVGRLGLFSRIVVNSDGTEAEYSGYPASYRRRLVRIDHGFDDKTSSLSQQEARASFGLPVGARVLGSVARLNRDKQLDLAIAILPKRPEWHLAIAGQGEARADLEALAERLGCRDRVHFVGELPSSRVGDLLASIDVFVFPSKSETFGLAAVEAAQAGVPIVANDLPVLRDVLSVDGQPCALFTPAEDAGQLLACLDRAVGDEELRHRLARAGRRLRDRFPLDRMIDGYEALLAEDRRGS